MSQKDMIYTKMQLLKYLMNLKIGKHIRLETKAGVDL